MGPVGSQSGGYAGVSVFVVVFFCLVHGEPSPFDRCTVKRALSWPSGAMVDSERSFFRERCEGAKVEHYIFGKALSNRSFRELFVRKLATFPSILEKIER